MTSSRTTSPSLLLPDLLAILFFAPIILWYRVNGFGNLTPLYSSLVVLVASNFISKLLLHRRFGLYDLRRLHGPSWYRVPVAAGIGAGMEILLVFLVLRPTGLVSVEFPRSVVTLDALASATWFLVTRMLVVGRGSYIVVQATVGVGIGIGLLQLWAGWGSSGPAVLQTLPDANKSLNIITPAARFARAPILFVVDRSDPNVYARYIAEILKAEGIVSFQTIDIATDKLDSALVESYALVIVAAGEGGIVRYEPLLSDYAAGGGSLFMIAPPTAFDSVLGISAQSGEVADGYISFDTSSNEGRGLVGKPLQFFGPAAKYHHTKANGLAWFCSPQGMGSVYPAVGIGAYGKGRTAFFAYDLGRSIAFQHQGKPPGVTSDNDGDGAYRSTDLFARTFDASNAFIPQADQQQRLFIRVIYSLLKEKIHLPRLWYFPHGSPAVALLTGDSHGTERSVVDSLVRFTESKGGRFTLFEYPTSLDSLYAHDLERRGDDVAPHAYYIRDENRAMQWKLRIARWFAPSYFYEPRISDLHDEISDAVRVFDERAGRTATLMRTHYLIWCGWSETPKLFAQFGIGMDFTITGSDPGKMFSIPGSEAMRSPTGFGYINGSGLPMRFIDERGEVVPVFEQLTIVEDDVLTGGLVGDRESDSSVIQKAILINKRLIDESIEEYHSALVYNFHPEHAVVRWPPIFPLSWSWVTATIEHLASRGVQMISGTQWLEFVNGRSETTIDSISADPLKQRFSFTLEAPRKVSGLTLMVPLSSTGAPLPTCVFSDPRDSGGVRIPLVSRMSFDGNDWAAVNLDLNPGDRVRVQYSISHLK